VTDSTARSSAEAGREETPPGGSSRQRTPRWVSVIGLAGAIAGFSLAIWGLWKWQLPVFALPGIGLGIGAATLVRRLPDLTVKRLGGSRWRAGLKDLIVALFPLPLFALVVTLFAAGGFAVWLQLLIGFSFAPYCLAIWHLEGPAAREAVGKASNVVAWTTPWFGVALLVGGIALASLALVLVRFAWGAVDRFIELGGWATLFSAGGVGLWLAAGALRLTGLASTAWRMLAIALLLFPLYHGAALLGVLPGYSTIGHVSYWFDVLAGVAGVGVLIADGFLPRLAPSAQRPFAGLLGFARELGLIVCVSAAVLFAGGVVLGKLSAGATHENHVDQFGTYHPGSSATLTPSTLDDLSLAYAYAPALDFDEKEQFFLIDIQDYLDDAKLLPLNGERVTPGPLTKDSLPTQCSNGGDRCFVLTCKNNEGGCAKPIHLDNGYYTGGVEYARVVHKTDATEAIFAIKTPFRDDLTTLVQYWLFYRYDKWESPTIAGWVTQQHEGDWEAVTLGFSPSKPLFVAYSAHCGGRWLHWREIEAEPRFRANGHWVARTSGSQPALHPIVAVARGSHANYVRAWHGRPTDWGSCGAHISQAITGALSYAWNVRDRTDESIEFLPAEIALVDENTPPMSFKGYWGLSDRATLSNFRHPPQPLGKPGDGPLSPPLQPLWINPLQRIFHGSHWQEGE
jgi:hypothetical protein